MNDLGFSTLPLQTIRRFTVHVKVQQNLEFGFKNVRVLSIPEICYTNWKSDYWPMKLLQVKDQDYISVAIKQADFCLITLSHRSRTNIILQNIVSQ